MQTGLPQVYARGRKRVAVRLPIGASVEIKVATGSEPDLIRHRELLDAVCGVEFTYPAERFAGRGIVICGGGEKYLPSVYVLVRLLRHLGCGLPIEVWHLGRREMPAGMQGLLAEHGVVCVDGSAVRRVHPARRLAGWELKCYAILHSSFQEVLLLDADNCPVRDPEFLFDTREYGETGALFWPDVTRFAEGQAVWVASGIAYREEPEFESGQIVVDKSRCWRALSVAMHLNEHSDWWYRVIHGDKDTFHVAWRKIGQDYAMPAEPVGALEATMLQYDFAGRLLFQHRNFAKWRMEGNRHLVGFKLEKECLGFIEELRTKWTPGLPLGVRRWNAANADSETQAVARELCKGQWTYERVGLGDRTMTFLPDGRIGEGGAACERWWNLGRMKDEGGRMKKMGAKGPRFRLSVAGEQGVTFRAEKNGDQAWHGAWLAFEKAAVVLRPVNGAGPQGKACCAPGGCGNGTKRHTVLATGGPL